MIILTDKSEDRARISKLPQQISEFNHLVQLKNHPDFEVVLSGIEQKLMHGVLSRAMESYGKVFIFVEAGKSIPWWVRFYASEIALSPVTKLERVNKVKSLLEGTLNYSDIMAHVAEAPMDELLLDCAELGVCNRAIISGMTENLRRKFITCDLLERYLKERGELDAGDAS